MAGWVQEALATMNTVPLGGVERAGGIRRHHVGAIHPYGIAEAMRTALRRAREQAGSCEVRWSPRKSGKLPSARG